MRLLPLGLVSKNRLAAWADSRVDRVCPAAIWTDSLAFIVIGRSPAFSDHAAQEADEYDNQNDCGEQNEGYGLEM
jgi:hypothetical protein